MQELCSRIYDLLVYGGILGAVLGVCLVLWLSDLISTKVTKGRLHPSAIAIFFGLILAYIGGAVTGGSKGLSDISLFGGLGVMGGALLRDFTIIASAYGADLNEIKKSGMLGFASLFVGVFSSYLMGAIAAVAFGYTDAVSVTTIASGAVTFLVGPVTGAALGADSTVIALSITAGLIKTIFIMIFTPLIAKKIGLTTPKMAMVYGGLVGSTSGISAGLAATDPKLVPYGTMVATFYSGFGCLLCPSVLYFLTKAILSLI